MKNTLIGLFLVITSNIFAQSTYTLVDSVRGSITSERIWWNLLHYELSASLNINDKYLSGKNTIKYQVLAEGQSMQIDLQLPMQISKVIQDGEELYWYHEGPNAYQIKLRKKQQIGDKNTLTVFYEGQPRTAIRAPWDGGVSWSEDADGQPFVATSCQGLGASVWWPCKDHMYDEPDEGMDIKITAPDGLMNVSNGRLIADETHSDGSRTTHWKVKSPINNYGVNMNIANYTAWKDTYEGEKGPLDLSFYVLPEDLTRAKEQFKEVYRMLKAFEHWFGPYPFYEDGYKLVQVPYLGMEHQSSVTYGNQFKNGYLGRDLSGTGWGLKWDFIIVHESGHEWFANNITYKDQADMWIHEGFTNYSENLFTEYFYGKKAGSEYVIGTRAGIKNDIPIIPPYHVNAQGSGDMYPKAGNMLHTIRQIVADDEKWRMMLRGLNQQFYHQTVDTPQIETFISSTLGFEVGKIFDQYLKTTLIPTLEWKNKGRKIWYRYMNTVEGFDMPIDVNIDGKVKRITPNVNWQKMKGKNLFIDQNYYVNAKKDRYN